MDVGKSDAMLSSCDGVVFIDVMGAGLWMSGSTEVGVLYSQRFVVGFGFVVRGESPGCRLSGTSSMLEWLRNPLLPQHSRGEQSGKMEPKYPEGGRCRSVLRPRFFLTSPFILNNSVGTAAPFNVVSHPRCCEPRN